ncbi:hypothetical protein VP1G_09310 [Cytospora mali]|uniref:Gag1-like clamp domain-containing protein n=1 Tax=Cytospora mali TaxID=578113 RepID=A0A194VDU8_CYTMA|nr:hypothetical protein VP1G_09310 [Valsa mali var. pyri (nom. inval.)]
MIFTDFYKSPKSPLSRLRHPHHSHLTLQSSDYDPDLVSKDKAKQKEAVKRHLQSKVRNDWTFVWPPVGEAPATTEPEPLKKPDEATSSADLEGFLEIASDDPELHAKEVDGDGTALNSGEEADSETESVYSIISETPLHWKPRLEWASELSDDELPYNSPSPFKFDTPDSIGQAVNASKIARKTRRRRELRKEMAWNEGLACFEARRNAWTEAKVARLRPKPVSPVSPSSPRKGLFWRARALSSSNAGQTVMLSASTTTPLTPVTTNSQPDALQRPPNSAGSDHSTPSNNLSPKTSNSDSQSHSNTQAEQYPVETLLPIPAPLLPPANPMRSSITPSLYSSIYEKVVVHSLQPSCPINLGDMVRACVSGWKRDGEWPPRPMAPEPATVVAVRRKKPSASAAVDMPMAPAGAGGNGRKMSFSFLGGHGIGHGGERDKVRRESIAEEGSGGSGTGKGIRRSLQKVLGIGQHPSPTLASVADGDTVTQAH